MAEQMSHSRSKRGNNNHDHQALTPAETAKTLEALARTLRYVAGEVGALPVRVAENEGTIEAVAAMFDNEARRLVERGE